MIKARVIGISLMSIIYILLFWVLPIRNNNNLPIKDRISSILILHAGLGVIGVIIGIIYLLMWCLINWNG